MDLRRPLDGVFDRATKVKILRVLASPGLELTGREIALEAGINHAGCNRALKHLVDLGIVDLEKKGRAHLYSLQHENILVAKGILHLFWAERDLLAELVDALRSRFAGRVVSSALFGSYVRGEETPRSDVDVLLLVQSDQEAVALESDILDLTGEFHRRFGVVVNPYVKTIETARTMARKRQPPFPSILAEGRDLFGRPFREVLRVGTDKARHAR